MDFYYLGWFGIVSIQNLYRSVAAHRILMVRKLFSPGLFYGVLLALGLSFFWAQYLSTSMFSFYHDWSGWRTITGGSTQPNYPWLGKNFLGSHFLFLLVDALEVGSIYLAIPQT